MVKTRELWAIDLGMVPYDEALALQFWLLEAKRTGQLDADVLLLLEHPPVITLGLRGNEDNIVVEAEVLADRDIQVHRIKRGGDVTYHGPGQLVVYPIVNLRQLPIRKNVKCFVWSMQEAIIRTLKSAGIPSERIDKVVGVWVRRPVPSLSLSLDPDDLPWDEAYRAQVDAMLRPFEDRKIAAIGARIKHRITFHGFALNVNTDLTDFDLIVPCGLQDRGVTSMQAELGRTLDMAPIKKEIAQHLVEQWGHQLVWKQKEEGILRISDHESRGLRGSLTTNQEDYADL